MDKTHLFLRRIPSVDRLLRDPEIKKRTLTFGRSRVVAHLQMILQEIREEHLSGKSDPGLNPVVVLTHLPSLLDRRLQADRQPHLRKVVNATGVVLHTNLGRSPMAENAAHAVAAIMTCYSNLEYDLQDGGRGHRDRLLKPVLQQLLSCEDATFVNNAAAALFLTLHEISRGGETIVSRGELIEIGGSFRIPEILSAAGSVLREVGTTNRTRASDYERAISNDTKMILKVHASNFRMVGFTEESTVGELSAIAARHHLPLVEDCGSGCLSLAGEGPFRQEPSPRQSLIHGCDLVIFSGDKLLGGPQSGIIAGKSSWVQRLRSNPMMRILRLDKMVLAALEATLRLYCQDAGHEEIPVLKMIGRGRDSLKKQAELLFILLSRTAVPGWHFQVVPMKSLVGGGCCPGDFLDSYGLRISLDECSLSLLEKKLREFQPPIIARVEEDGLLLDTRTLLPGDEKHLWRFFSGTDPKSSCSGN